MKHVTSLAIGAALAAAIVPAAPAAAASWKETPGMYAVFETNYGTITAQLFPDEAPKTVENFVGLAEGTKEYTDPNTGQKAKRHYYDGTSFHRIISGFMMQGGDPLGTGNGGPGYTIEDEFSPKLKFDKPGRLAMARTRQPHSAGSQFFITQARYPSLDGSYAIFGQVVEGQEIVDKICTQFGGSGEEGRPKQPVTLKSLKIQRVGGAGGGKEGAKKPASAQTKP